MAKTDIQFTGVEAIQDLIRRTESFRTARIRFHEQISEVWADAAAAFVRAAMLKILVETGMSAASFLALSREINRSGALEAINDALNDGPPIFYPKRAPTFPSGARSNVQQGVSAGDSLGEKAYIFRTGSPTRYGFRFRFQTVVYQHAFHERRQRTLEAGYNAFVGLVNDRVGPVGASVVREWLTGRKTFTVPGTRSRSI